MRNQRRKSQATTSSAAAHSGADVTTAGWLRLVLLGVGAFVIGTDAFIVAGLLPDMANGLGVSQPAAGQTVTVFALSYALLSPLLATVTARQPRHRLLMIGLAVLAAANLLVSVADDLSVALLARIVAAAGAALFTPTAITVSAGLVPESRRGMALSVVPGGLTVATVFGVPLGTLAGQEFGWRVVLASISALAALVILVMFWAMPRASPEAVVPVRERLSVLRRGDILAALSVTVFGVGGSYAVYTYASSVLSAGVGLPVAAISVQLLAYGVGAVGGTIIGGLGVDRLGARRVLVTAFMVQVVALTALWALGVANVISALLTAIVVAAWGAGTWMQIPPQQARLMQGAPLAGRVVIAFNASAIYVGIGFGGLFGGLLLGRLGSGYLPLLGAAVAASALVLLLMSRDPEHRGEAKSEPSG